jgi:hypothetical protein
VGIRTAVAEERSDAGERWVADGLRARVRVGMVDERPNLDRLGLHVVTLEHDPDGVDQLAPREGPLETDDFPHLDRRNQEAEPAVPIAERVGGLYGKLGDRR